MSGSIAYDNTNMTPVKVRETALATRILEKLVAEFPDYDWHVEVSFDAEVCWVRLGFSGNWGYTLHLDKLIYDPDLKVVRWAAGELLERYNLSRVRADQEAIALLPTNARGFATPQM